MPDLPNCSVEAASLDAALATLAQRAQELATQLAGNGTRLPPARSLQRLMADQEWNEGAPIDWSQAITSIVHVPGDVEVPEQETVH